MRADSSSEPETTNQKLEASSGEIITNSPEETFAFARSLGERLTGGEVFLLKGDLGAGKTVFAKGLAAGVGIAYVDGKSPAFIINNENTGPPPPYLHPPFRLSRSMPVRQRHA